MTEDEKRAAERTRKRQRRKVIRDGRRWVGMWVDDEGLTDLLTACGLLHPLDEDSPSRVNAATRNFLETYFPKRDTRDTGSSANQLASVQITILPKETEPCSPPPSKPKITA